MNTHHSAVKYAEGFIVTFIGTHICVVSHKKKALLNRNDKEQYTTFH